MPETQPTVINPSEFEKAFLAGRKAEADSLTAQTTIHHVGTGGKPFILLNNQLVDVEAYLPRPIAIRKNLVFTDVPSFCRYVNMFKDEGTVIFGKSSIQGASFQAVLDYNIAPVSVTPQTETGHATPRWGSHTAIYDFPTTPEWQELLKNNGKMLKQLEFAEMAERLKLNFIAPNGATMLEIARTLEANIESTFKSSINTDNGDRELIYTTLTNGQAGRGEKLFIPNELKLTVAPFVRGGTFNISAIFRYRVSSGAVTFQYELIKPHEFIDLAVLSARQEIEIATNIDPLMGS